MSTYTIHPSQHLTDEELLCIIDGERDAGWRADRESHVDTCTECALALQALAADGDIIREWLGHAAFEEGGGTPGALPPQSRPLPGPAPRDLPRPVSRLQPRALPAWLKAAAVIALIAAPVAALPGVRAWVVDIVDGSQRHDVATTAAPAASTTAAVIRFVPDPGSFVIDVDAVQAAGELFIGRAAGADAIIEQVAGDATADTGPAREAGIASGPVVSPTSLRIRNDADGRTRYALHVPAAVTRVTVRVAGAVAAVLDAAAIDNGTSIRLHTP